MPLILALLFLSKLKRQAPPRELTQMTHIKHTCMLRDEHVTPVWLNAQGELLLLLHC